MKLISREVELALNIMSLIYNKRRLRYTKARIDELLNDSPGFTEIVFTKLVKAGLIELVRDGTTCRYKPGLNLERLTVRDFMNAMGRDRVNNPLEAGKASERLHDLVASALTCPLVEILVD